MSAQLQTQTKAAPQPFFTSVQTGLLQRKCACGQHTIAGGECEDCSQKHEGVMQRADVNAVPPIVDDELSSSGRPLDAGTRAFMEPRFGHDFSQVRVLTDGRAGESARVVNALVPVSGRNHRQRIWFDPQADPRLPDFTPAWTEKGYIHLSVPSLFMPVVERQKMLRHEAIHSLHQQLAPQSETTDSREHAERLATHGEQNGSKLSSTDFLQPVPALLAYPPQKYSPWTTVWIGYAGLIGEVVRSGVTVRIFEEYHDINLVDPQSYECDGHDKPPIPDLVKKMQDIARKTAELNTKIPKTATEQRIALVAVFGDSSSSAFRVANGKGLLIVGKTDFNAGKYEDVIAHEGAHAIFEYHSVHKDLEKRVPDALALDIADIYNSLAKTKLVPVPTAKFDPKHPPALEVPKEPAAKAPKSPSDAGELPSSEFRTDKAPAGLVMVMDTLWSGAGGHPWQGVDEFFASAYAGFLQQPDLLRRIINYYQKADPKIKPLADKLSTLLAMVGKPEKLKKLAGPAEPGKAQETLGRVPATLDESSRGDRLGWLIDPLKMPAPDTILCLSPAPPSSKPARDPLDIELSPGTLTNQVNK